MKRASLTWRRLSLAAVIALFVVSPTAPVSGDDAPDGESPKPPQGTVTGTVVTPDGQPVAGADVLAFQGIYLKERFRTDAQGQFQVPKDWRGKNPFRSVVARVGPDRLGWFSFSMHKFSKEGQHNPDGSFRIVLLPLSRTVQGRLTDAEKKPLAGVPVHVEFMSHEVNLLDSHWPRRAVDGERLLPGTVTDKDGAFTLPLPADASATLRAVHPDWAARRLTVKKDQSSLAPARLEPAAKVAGVVTDARTGKPMKGVRVAAQMASRQDIMRHGGWGEAETDENGRYVIGSLTGAKWDIMLMGGFKPPLIAPGSPNVELKNGETHETSFVLKPGRRLAGKVVDDVTGKPVADCTVHCAGVARPGGNVLSTQTGKRGEFHFYVPPGKSRVYVSGRRSVLKDSATISIREDDEGEPQPVVLRAGPEEEIRLRYFTGQPLERRVSLEAKRATFENALKAVCTDAGLILELDAAGLKQHGYTKNMVVTLTLTDVPLRDALIHLLQPYKELGFTLDGIRVYVSDRTRVNAREAQQKKKRLKTKKQTMQAEPVSSRLQSFAKGAGFQICQVTSHRSPIADAQVTVTYQMVQPDGPISIDSLAGNVLHTSLYRTGQDGVYRIEVPGELAGIPNLELSVSIRHPQYLPRSLGPIPITDFDMQAIGPKERLWRHRTDSRRAILQTVLRAGQQLTGRVLLPDGKPAAAATVFTRTKYRPYSWKFPDPDHYSASAMTKTDEQGRFQLLADQQAILTVSMPGQAPLILDDLGKRVVAEGDPPNTFRLPRGVRPQGRVTKFDGTPVPGAVVSIRRNAPYNEFNMPVFFSRNCAADGNGEYQLPPVPAGSYLMSVSSALEDVAQCDEFNRPEDFRSHPRLMLATTSVPTRPLTEVILGTVQAFGEEDEQPQVDFRAVETYSIDVRIEREEGVDPTNRVVDLTVRGFLGKDRWSGRSVKAGPDGIARLTVPKGIDNVVIGTGLARHRREPDGPEEIGEAIHLGHVDGNISGIVVTQPALAKLVVDVTYSKPTTNIGLSSWHVRHGFKDQGGKKQPIYLVASRQTGNYQYRGTALPDEDIIFQVYRRDKGTFQVLHKQQLRLNAGEERSLKVKIQVP